MEPVKRKRGRPRKYVTPEQALAAKKLASSASSSSAKQRRELAAVTGGTVSTNSGSSKKSQLGSVGKTGQCFTPHIVNIAPGEVCHVLVHSRSLLVIEICWCRHNIYHSFNSKSFYFSFCFIDTNANRGGSLMILSVLFVILSGCGPENYDVRKPKQA